MEVGWPRARAQASSVHRRAIAEHGAPVRSQGSERPAAGPAHPRACLASTLAAAMARQTRSPCTG